MTTTPDTPADFLDMSVASQLFPKAKLHLAEPHPLLQSSAEWCATEQARLCRQGHHDWQRRFNELLDQFGDVGKRVRCFMTEGEYVFSPYVGPMGTAGPKPETSIVQAQGDRWTFAEVAAESWPRQSNDSPAALWADAFRSWSFSAGHWRVASTRHKIAGAAMRMGRNGIWYTAVVTGDEEQ